MSENSLTSATSKVESLRQLFRELSIRDFRNVILGTVVVLGGVALALVTLYAHRTGNVQLAGITAGISLIFALVILVFVVPPLARNAHREAQQMNLPFEITVSGAVMLVLIIVVGFSAWNTGNNLLFLVFSFLVAACFVGFLAGGLSLKKLDVKLRLPETIFANEATPISLILENRKRILPAFSVVVDVRSAEAARTRMSKHVDNLLPDFLAKRINRVAEVTRTFAHFPYLAARSTEETRLDYLFEKRGRITIRNFELSTRFPFGFFRHRRRLPARETELIVFPQLVEIEQLGLTSPIGVGRLASLKVGTGQDLLSLRDYRRDDDLRKIDWKATARSRSLTVREFAAEDELRVSVIFDRKCDDPERFEKGVSKAAAILTQLLGERAEFRLLLDGEVEFGMGRAHWIESLSRLAVTDFSAEPCEIPDEIEGPGSHTVLVTSQEMGETADSALKIVTF